MGMDNDPGKADLGEIANVVRAGLLEAHREYVKWTGDWPGAYAPEYLFTVYVARAFAGWDDAFITLETRMDELKDASGGWKRGRPESAARSRAQQRCDMVLWNAEDQPVGLIEVKTQNQNMKSIGADLGRLRGIVSHGTKNSFRFGILAYYYFVECDLADGAARKGARAELERIWGNIRSKCSDSSDSAKPDWQCVDLLIEDHEPSGVFMVATALCSTNVELSITNETSAS
jgi:hypothetical protein